MSLNQSENLTERGTSKIRFSTAFVIHLSRWNVLQVRSDMEHRGHRKTTQKFWTSALPDATGKCSERPQPPFSCSCPHLLHGHRGSGSGLLPHYAGLRSKGKPDFDRGHELWWYDCDQLRGKAGALERSTGGGNLCGREAGAMEIRGGSCELCTRMFAVKKGSRQEARV